MTPGYIAKALLAGGVTPLRMHKAVRLAAKARIRMQDVFAAILDEGQRAMVERAYDSQAQDLYERLSP